MCFFCTLRLPRASGNSIASSLHTEHQVTQSHLRCIQRIVVPPALHTEECSAACVAYRGLYRGTTLLCMQRRPTCGLLATTGTFADASQELRYLSRRNERHLRLRVCNDRPQRFAASGGALWPCSAQQALPHSPQHSRSPARNVHSWRWSRGLRLSALLPQSRVKALLCLSKHHQSLPEWRIRRRQPSGTQGSQAYPIVAEAEYDPLSNAIVRPEPTCLMLTGHPQMADPDRAPNSG